MDSQEPHERTSLIESNRHYESRSADEEAAIGASESSKADAAARPTAGIAGVIAVLLLGMCVYRYSAVWSRSIDYRGLGFCTTAYFSRCVHSKCRRLYRTGNLRYHLIGYW